MEVNLTQHITAACKQAKAIAEVYAKLRGATDNQTRTDLLKRAESYADTLNAHMRIVNKLTNGNLPDATSVAAMHELGNVMEQIMIQEREYRISAGGNETVASGQHKGQMQHAN